MVMEQVQDLMIKNNIEFPEFRDWMFIWDYEALTQGGQDYTREEEQEVERRLREEFKSINSLQDMFDYYTQKEWQGDFGWIEMGLDFLISYNQDGYSWGIRHLDF
jgi:hypothetical protein